MIKRFLINLGALAAGITLGLIFYYKFNSDNPNQLAALFLLLGCAGLAMIAHGLITGRMNYMHWIREVSFERKDFPLAFWSVLIVWAGFAAYWFVAAACVFWQIKI